MITMLYADGPDGEVMSEVASTGVPKQGDFDSVYDLFQDEWGCKHPMATDEGYGQVFEIVTVDEDVSLPDAAPGGVLVFMGEGTGKRELEYACAVVSLRLDEGEAEGLDLADGLVELEIVAVPDDLFLSEGNKLTIKHARMVLQAVNTDTDVEVECWDAADELKRVVKELP